MCVKLICVRKTEGVSFNKKRERKTERMVSIAQYFSPGDKLNQAREPKSELMMA